MQGRNKGRVQVMSKMCKVFRDNEDLKDHVWMEHESKCDQCGKQYECIIELEEHMKTEHEKVKKDETKKKGEDKGENVESSKEDKDKEDSEEYSINKENYEENIVKLKKLMKILAENYEKLMVDNEKRRVEVEKYKKEAAE